MRNLFWSVAATNQISSNVWANLQLQDVGRGTLDPGLETRLPLFRGGEASGHLGSASRWRKISPPPDQHDYEKHGHSDFIALWVAPPWAVVRHARIRYFAEPCGTGAMADDPIDTVRHVLRIPRCS